MRRIFTVTLFLFATIGGCGELPEEEVDSRQDALICPVITGCHPTTSTVDCRTSGDSSCYECGNPNGVMCCIGSCTVIPAQPQVQPPPSRRK